MRSRLHHSGTAQVYEAGTADTGASIAGALYRAWLADAASDAPLCEYLLAACWP